MSRPSPELAPLRLLEAGVNRRLLPEAHELVAAAFGHDEAMAAQRALTARIRADVLGEPDDARVEPPATDVWDLLRENARAHRLRLGRAS